MNTTFLTAFVLSAVTLGYAANCTPGLNYCGSTLLTKGNYRAQLDQTYRTALGIDVTDDSQWTNTLFECLGGRSGTIGILAICGAAGCSNNGAGNNDTCA